MRKVQRLLWQITAVAVALVALGMLVGAIGTTNDGGDTGILVVIGVVTLVVGLALGFYAAWQWFSYYRARALVTGGTTSGISVPRPLWRLRWPALPGREA